MTSAAPITETSARTTGLSMPAPWMVSRIQVQGEDSRHRDAFRTGQRFEIAVRVLVRPGAPASVLIVTVHRRDGSLVVDAHSPLSPSLAAEANPGEAREIAVLMFIEHLGFPAGVYEAGARIARRDNGALLDECPGPRFLVRSPGVPEEHAPKSPPRFQVPEEAAVAEPGTPAEGAGPPEREFAVPGPGALRGAVLPPFSGIQVEASAACNLKCKDCYIYHYDRPVKTANLDAGAWRAIAGSVRDAWHVDLGGWGEPLLNPAVFDMIRHFREQGARTVILATNASMLDERRAARLIESGLTDLNVSIDAADPDTHANLREGSDFAAVWGNLRRLEEMKRERGASLPRVQASLVLSRANIEELPLFVERAASVGVREVVVRHLIPLTAADATEVLYEGFYDVPVDVETRDRAVRRARNLAWDRGVALLFLGPWHITGPLPTCFCDAMSVPFVNAEGEVSPCCFLGHPVDRVMRDRSVRNFGVLSFGNVKDAPLPDIWESEKFRRFRRLHRQGRAPQCEDCPALYLFQR